MSLERFNKEQAISVPTAGSRSELQDSTQSSDTNPASGGKLLEWTDPNSQLTLGTVNKVLRERTWTAGGIDTYQQTWKPQVQGRLRLNSTTFDGSASASVRIGFRALSKHILSIELKTQKLASSWFPISWANAQIKVLNIRLRTAPIFKACLNLDVPAVKRLLATGEASVFDVDDFAQAGLLEVCNVS
jgi:hypothetical protein